MDDQIVITEKSSQARTSAPSLVRASATFFLQKDT